MSSEQFWPANGPLDDDGDDDGGVSFSSVVLDRNVLEKNYYNFKYNRLYIFSVCR